MWIIPRHLSEEYSVGYRYLNFHIWDVVRIEPSPGDTLLGGYVDQFDVAVLRPTN